MITKASKFRKSRPKENWQSRIGYGAGVVVVILLITALAAANSRLNKRKEGINFRLNFLQERIEQLEEKNNSLKAAISQGVTEDYLEKEARNNMNFKKPDEEVVVVLPVPEEKQAVQDEVKNLWQKFFKKMGF